jgi:glucuronate isomerase
MSEQGLLSTFPGMLTDSRSFLSYARHDYFRRILCNRIGQYVESGEFDGAPAEELCRRISYTTSKKMIEE